MRIVEHRSRAVALACTLLDKGVEVTGVGPMLELCGVPHGKGGITAAMDYLMSAE